MKKLILTDQSNFADIRRQGGLYVDKTKEIYDCISTGKYYFLSRPRRFGKSLLCSTLREMFLGNKDLFEGLWIYSSNWSWDRHPIIHLDMTLAAGNTSTAIIMTSALRIRLQEIAQAYDFQLKPHISLAQELWALITGLAAKFQQRVVVIIDEYDKPVLDLIDNPTERNEVQKVLHDFYAPLKALDENLRFVFLTGVYKFSKTSIFSGLNNLTDLTFASQAGTLVGYTQEELEANFSDEIDTLASKEKITRFAMLKKLREQYNGYHFGVDNSTGKLSPSTYNPFALNHTFAANQMIEQWFASGSPSFLIKKIKTGDFESIDPQGLEIPFNDLQNSCDPDRITATSLLYYAGYATMREFDPHTRLVRLGFPNLEVSQATSKELLGLFSQHGTSTTYKLAIKIADCFRQHRLDDLKDLFNQALAQLTYQIIISQEKYFQTVILLVLQMGKLRANAEIPTNDGSMDIVVEIGNEIFIVELKFNKPAANGLLQIKNKDYAKKFKSQGLKLTAVGLSVAIGKDIAANKCIFDVVSEEL